MISLTSQMESSIRVFMKAFDQEIFFSPTSTPCKISALRATLIKEEAQEFCRAPARSTEELDAIIDLLYVVIGTNITMSVPVFAYRSGQIKVEKPEKQLIFDFVRPMLSDLECLFPCPKIQTKTSNELIGRLFDLGKYYGYDLEGAFAAVHKANMSKLWSFHSLDPEHTSVKKDSGYLVKRKDQKVVKPLIFTPPDLTPFLTA